MSKKKKLSSVKKSSVKKASTTVKKKADKKNAKKATKPVKKAAPKKIVKKASKPVAKKPVKKPAKVVKPVKKATVKVKPAPKVKVKEVKNVKPVKPAKEVKKVVVAKPVAKNAEPKVAKPIVEKPIIKKEVVEKVEKNAAKANSDIKSDSGKVLAISNTIPKQEVESLSAFKIASISSSITNPVKKNDSYSVKPEKEPSGKFEMEFVVRSSPEMLFEFLSTPSGLSEWFCDDVNIRNGIYTFIWDGQLQQARLLKTIEDQLVRFQWVDKTDGSYFEFKIQKDDLTNDTSLIITDFAESVSERESSKLLWQSQVEKLLQIIGSIF